MARCLDARLALAKLPVAESMSSGSVVVLLTDKMIERNNHLLQLRHVTGQAGSSQHAGAGGGYHGYGSLYPALLRCVQRQRAVGGRHIKCSDVRKLQLLDELFPKCRTYNNEYF